MLLGMRIGPRHRRCGIGAIIAHEVKNNGAKWKERIQKLYQ